MEIEVIDHAVNNEYTEFSKGVRADLSAKLAAHVDVAAYYTEIDATRATKAAFVAMSAPAVEDPDVQVEDPAEGE